MAGVSLPGIEYYETECVIGYLISRHDVDAGRLGYRRGSRRFETWVTAALDDRIKAMLPVGGTFDLANKIAEMRETDWDHAADQRMLIPGVLRYANIQEFAVLIAPRNLMIAADNDARPVFNYVQRLYAGFNQVQRVRFSESSGTAYSKSQREAAYGFFLDALLAQGDGRPVRKA
jgi:hypothetical protein